MVKHAEASEEEIAPGILRKLDRAVRTGELVRIRRSIAHADRIEGFVVGVSPAWTLIAPCSDVQIDGWAAVRTPDIVKVRRRGDDTCLTVRALRRRGQWPVRMPGRAVPLDGPAALAESAADGFGLITVHAERRRPDACWIGALTAVRRASLRVREVDPDARWQDDVTTFRFKDITRIDFGGRYESVLREFAGPAARPGPPSSARPGRTSR
ncbi:hypothetical protein [Streptomyces ficellus]|uniref:Uncharacterized protein n=1 Tax=Streptomyces ficellus TaxID=1977088 RepID=A0A6I6FGQ6_9ACTN|nr:hypothetical protein [Streptomyces ficellus]QGV82291.1 hypothetical protein EIZ62_31565 [Streptomyces ficellus]